MESSSDCNLPALYQGERDLVFNVAKRITHALTVFDVFKVCIDHYFMLNVSFVLTECN